MTTTGGWWVTSVIVPFVMAVVAWFYYNYWLKPEGVLQKFKRQGIPGCPFHPFLGNIPEIQEAKKELAGEPASAKTAIPFLELMERKLGGTYTYCFGPTPRLVTTDPALIRQILVAKHENFKKIPAAAGIKLFGNGLATSSGAIWHRQRSMLDAAFIPSKIKTITQGVEDSTNEAVHRWRSLIGREKSATFQMHEDLNTLALNASGRLVFGADIDGMRVVAAKVVPLLAEYLDLVPKWLHAGGNFPGYRYMPTALNLKLAETEKAIKDLLLGLIRRRRLAKSLRKEEESMGNVQSEPQADLLEIMLRATSVESESSSKPTNTTVGMDGEYMDDQQLLEECVSLVTAGFETMAAVLTWTMLLLAKYSDWQEKLREEVRSVCGGTDSVTEPPTLNLQYDKLNSLAQLHTVVLESLRLFPPSTLLSRKCNQDTSLVGLKVPEGTEVILPVIQIHRQKDVWGQDAEDFKPERFANGVAAAAKHPLAFLPFGAGPRNCLGQDFALAQAKIMLAIILNNFKWSAAPTYRHCPLAALTLRPNFGMPLIMEKL